MIYGNVSDTLSQLIRTAFIATPGNVLIDADFSAIEARVIAWLAGRFHVDDTGLSPVLFDKGRQYLLTESLST